MFRGVQRFARSPIGRRVLIWLAPIVVGWIAQQFAGTSKSTKRKTDRKSVKNRAK